MAERETAGTDRKNHTGLSRIGAERVNVDVEVY